MFLIKYYFILSISKYHLSTHSISKSIILIFLLSIITQLSISSIHLFSLYIPSITTPFDLYPIPIDSIITLSILLIIIPFD